MIAPSHAELAELRTDLLNHREFAVQFRCVSLSGCFACQHVLDRSEQIA